MFFLSGTWGTEVVLEAPFVQAVAQWPLSSEKGNKDDNLKLRKSFLYFSFKNLCKSHLWTDVFYKEGWWQGRGACGVQQQQNKKSLLGRRWYGKVSLNTFIFLDDDKATVLACFQTVSVIECNKAHKWQALIKLVKGPNPTPYFGLISLKSQLTWTSRTMGRWQCWSAADLVLISVTIWCKVAVLPE